MAIPKRIHYCWFGLKSLPRDALKCIKSWETKCPDYEIVRWDESNFDIAGHSFTASAYAHQAWAFVSDYARLKVVYDNGGIYLDTDVELLRSLDPLLASQCYIGVQQTGRLCNTGLGFGAAKASPVVHKMLAKYDGLVYEPARMAELACPYSNNAVLEEMGYAYTDSVMELPNATVYPCKFFDPIAPGESEYCLCDETYSIHHYGASWQSKRVALKRKLIRMIGVQRVAKLKRELHE